MVAFTRNDLEFVLTQIKMAEAGQPPLNALLSFGLCKVDGTDNNVVAGQGTFGATDQTVPRITDPLLQNAQAGTSYASASGLVIDSQPRTISNLISDQTTLNPAAIAAQIKATAFLGAGYQATLPGPDGIIGTPDDVVGNLATPAFTSSSSSTVPGLAPSLFINNVTPDNGLSAPFSSLFTFFGQFFDHGLDLINKGGSGTVFIPLAADDPLFVLGGHSNFMVLTRATNQPGPDGILGTADDVHDSTNTVTPFVDQSQTYSSHPSHQVFLREYAIGADGKLHSTGALLGHRAAGTDGVLFTADDTLTMATWADVKLNAATFLGIRLADADVGNVPLLATDSYGNFIPGANGLPQLVVKNTDGTTSLVEGNLANPIATTAAVRVGIAFIADMAHNASPFDNSGVALKPDANVPANGVPAPGFYDSKLLDAHYAAGDGRVNENIGLTAIQNVFHSEHNRLLAQTKAVVQAELDKGDISFAASWVLPSVDLTILNDTKADGTRVHTITDAEWDGGRLFQVAKFGTETQYQHLVFEEFARKVDPAVHLFHGVSVHLNPAIMAEFANVVYRFGHSMLDENVNIYKIDPATGKPLIDPATGQPVMTQVGLIQAFTNPLAFAKDPNATADIVLGSVNQVGNEIDEFVTGSLRNNLLGLPLDLPALNIARGRDTGVAPLNLVRNQIYSQTNDVQLRPYASWDDFGHYLRHPESLVNFIAAYGSHADITAATTLAGKRAAADALVHKGTLGDPAFDLTNLDAYNFMHSLGAYANDKLNARAIHDAAGQPAAWSTGSVTGLDQVDLWIGGLAEKQNLFGSVLGSTFETIFRTQLESLQDGDRLYYLLRVEGTHFGEEIEDASFAALIRENTGIKHLPGSIFLTPEYTIESSDYFQKNADGSFILDGNGNHVATTDTSKWLHNPATGKLLVNVTPDGTVVFLGDDNFLGNTIVMGGTEGNDKLTAGAADDDTIWGDGGNDVIDGGGGNDFLYGGDGNDTIFGGQGNDVVHGDAGDDTIYGGDGLDNLFGSNGNDFIDGGRQDDIIQGGLGNDILIGGEGDDTLVGNEGDDWIEGGLGGDALVGDFGAPTGQLPLYGGNDVLISGPDGGDRMQGFSGDDIMLGVGSFDKFEGRLGFDWASYEEAIHGVDADLTRREFIAANGSEDTIRDFFIAVEGASGSAFDDILKGSDNSKLLTTKDELSNVNLITGLSGFFDPGVVAFDGGNILLGGAGSDTLIGGGGNDIIDGDAWLHVALTKHAAGGQIIRQILFDANGNTWDPVTGNGNVNPANVDTAVFNDIRANYNIAQSGQDAEGFLTIQHVPGAAAAAGGIDDGTDRIRHIERLQFTDGTVAIDANGFILDPTVNDPHYDAVPVGAPLVTETAAGPGGGAVNPATTVTVGNTLTANIAGMTDADGIVSAVSLQWQTLNVVRNVWIPIVGATGATFIPTAFQEGQSIRVQATYIDGKGFKEVVNSVATALTTLPGNVNTAPFVVVQQQLTGIPDTSGNQGVPVDFFVPLTLIFADAQTASNALLYSATLGDGLPLASLGLAFSFDPVTGAGHFSGTLPVEFTGPLPVRVTVTDTGPGTPLSVTNTFVINILPANLPPLATNDAYKMLENAPLAIQTVLQGVLANDVDPNSNPITASLVAGPVHGTLTLNAAGTFIYTPTADFIGTDTFTYQAVDSLGAASNVATVTITVQDRPVVTMALVQDTGVSATDRITSNPAVAGTGVANVAVFASIDGGVTVQIGTSDAVGAWSFTPTLNNGVHTIAVTETNLDGNTANTSLTFTLDKAGPATPVLRGFADIATNAALISYTLSGTAEAGSTVALFDGGAAPLGTVTAAATGTWSLTGTSATPDNILSNLTVTATDAAGNVSSGLLAGLIVGTAGNNAGPTALLAAGGLASVPNLIVGLGGNDVLSGGTAADTLDGGAGDDILDGGTNLIGLDRLIGGTGNDTFIVHTSGTVTFERPNEGIDTVKTDLARYAVSSNVENIIYTGTGNFTGIGNNLANTITGGAGNDILDGGKNTIGTIGVDRLVGGAGDDTYIVRNLKTVTLELRDGGIDTVKTELALYAVSSNVENIIYTGTGNFTGIGNNLANTITGGAGNDTLDSGRNTIGTVGVDSLIGGAGDDIYIIRNASDVVVELAGEGTDTVQSAINNCTLAANVENLTFIGIGAFTGVGNELANVITGGVGADNLDGGAGGDTLIGGAGADTLTGGAGSDTFVLAKGDANGDLITDFTQAGANGTDQISFIGYGLGAVLVKIATGTATQPTSYAVQVGEITQDTFKLTGDITLVAADFKFA